MDPILTKSTTIHWDLSQELILTLDCSFERCLYLPVSFHALDSGQVSDGAPPVPALLDLL